jgi:hypothetical protein
VPGPAALPGADPGRCAGVGPGSDRTAPGPGWFGTGSCGNCGFACWPAGPGEGAGRAATPGGEARSLWAGPPVFPGTGGVPGAGTFGAASVPGADLFGGATASWGAGGTVLVTGGAPSEFGEFGATGAPVCTGACGTTRGAGACGTTRGAGGRCGTGRGAGGGGGAGRGAGGRGAGITGEGPGAFGGSASAGAIPPVSADNETTAPEARTTTTLRQRQTQMAALIGRDSSRRDGNHLPPAPPTRTPPRAHSQERPRCRRELPPSKRRVRSGAGTPILLFSY